MEALFIKILNMSITACWMILAAIFLRLILKKAPKNIRFVLWAMVGIRLICPISFESIFSMVPTPTPISGELIFTKVPTAVNTALATTPSTPSTAEPQISAISVLAIIWLIGVAAMTVYAVFSYFNIHRKVKASLKTENNVYICDDIDSPFILGIFRPKIYLPSDLSAEEVTCVLAHERSHIKRLDHIWKTLGFAILSVYWFNPMIWVAYILLCRDIELACDEKVIKKMDVDEKRRYSQALLSCSISRRTISACPLAFGEVGVKSRVRSILNYKKPMFWVIIVSVILCLIAGLLFITDPKTDKTLNIPEGNNSLTFICEDPMSETTIIKPSITLYSEDRSFSFTFSALSSYWPIGEYEITDGKLIATTDDGLNHYVFDIISESKISFNEAESSELPTYRIQGNSGDSYKSEKPIKDGAIFELAEVITSDNATVGGSDEPISVDLEKVQNDYEDVVGKIKYLIYSKSHPTKPAAKIELVLYEEYNDFVLAYPVLSSVGVWGTYEKSGNQLICTSNDGNYKYVFDITDEGYVFREEVPFEHPQYNKTINMEALVDGDILVVN